MADKIPVKARYSGSDVITLGELEAGDTINASYISGLSGGTVLQMIHSSNGSNVSDSTELWVSSGTTLTITPTSTSSKIYLTFTGSVRPTAGTSGQGMGLQIQRGATTGANGSQVVGNQWNYEAEQFLPSNAGGFYTPSGVYHRSLVTMAGVDEPNTTSAVTYTVMFASHSDTTANLNTEHPRSFLALEF